MDVQMMCGIELTKTNARGVMDVNLMGPKAAAAFFTQTRTKQPVP
jgi:hypothetical protein